MVDSVRIGAETCTGKKRPDRAFLAWVIIVSFLANGCAVKRVGVEDQRAATLFREVLVRQVEYTEKGLPVPGPELKTRPSRAHQQFTIAQFTNNQLATSFDISVAEQNSDFTKPFKAVYRWTGKGFQRGLKVSSAIANSGVPNITSGEELVVYLVIIVSPIAACAAGGVVIGVADGIRQTAVELGKVVVNRRERVATFTTYAYDVRNRLSLMRMYKADDRAELVRTEFVYEGDSPVPHKTTITRYPEGTVQVLQ